MNLPTFGTFKSTVLSVKSPILSCHGCQLTCVTDPYFYIPKIAFLKGSLEKSNKETKKFWVGKLSAGGKSTERVLIFEAGPLEGLVRIEVSALGNHHLTHLPSQTSTFTLLKLLYRCMVRRRRKAPGTPSQGSVQAHRNDPFVSRNTN